MFISILNWYKGSWFIIEKVDIKNITTEKINQNTLNIDTASSIEIAKLINNEDKKVPVAVEEKLNEIASAIDLAHEALVNNGRVVYVGAGTSGRLGVLDASEIPPTFSSEPEQFIGIIAGGDRALRHAIENAEDSKEFAIEDLTKINLNEKDLLVGIAASGRTPYVISAVEFAKSRGCKTVSITNSENSKVSALVDVAIEIVSGPEAITGSTRMKSGTGQKLVLNMISTGAMIKFGKVYKNLMVDLRPTNEKLIQRSIGIVKEITSKTTEEVEKVMEENNYDVKVSSIILLTGMSKDEAVEALKKNNNKLGGVLNDRS